MLAVYGRSTADSVMSEVQDFFVERIIDHKELLPAQYKHFANGDNLDNLTQLLLNNPFATSALSLKGDHYYITSVPYRAHGGEYPLNPWYLDLIKGLSHQYPLVNAKFNKTTMQLEDYQVFVYDPADNLIPATKSIQDVAADLLFLLSFYYESVHALIHVFQYMHASALSVVAEQWPVITQWSLTYLKNLGLKYEEVELVLLGGNYGFLTGVAWNSDGESTRAALRRVLVSWGESRDLTYISDGY